MRDSGNAVVYIVDLPKKKTMFVSFAKKKKKKRALKSCASLFHFTWGDAPCENKSSRSLAKNENRVSQYKWGARALVKNDPPFIVYICYWEIRLFDFRSAIQYTWETHNIIHIALLFQFPRPFTYDACLLRLLTS